MFVLQPDDRFCFGRVVSTEAWAGPSMSGAILVYIYRFRSATPDGLDLDALTRDRLLLPPMMTNRLPWSRGYFDTIAQVPLAADDVLPRHCFLNAPDGRYFDEARHELGGPVEPVGEYGLHSFRTIDDAVSEALGIPLTPD